MACHNSFPNPFLQFFLITYIHLLLPSIDALSFNFSSFNVNQANIINLDWDATFYGSSIFLTKTPQNGPLNDSVGRALYYKPMSLWEINDNTKKLADFSTNFSFKIYDINGYDGNGHGLAFLLVPENAKWFPNRDKARLLGLFESEWFAINDTSRNRVVAIEFDTHGNYKEWGETRNEHIGIDVNSIVSKSYVNVTGGGLVNQGIANVRVSYDSTSKNLSVGLTFEGSLKSFGVSYIVDLSVVLAQRVKVGFTAATATYVEIHELCSWSFNSSIEEASNQSQPHSPQSQPQSPQSPPSMIRKEMGLVVGVMVGVFVFTLLSGGVALYWIWPRRRNAHNQGDLGEIPLIYDQNCQSLLVEDLGPKNFSYLELCEATNGFNKELILGKGGFGDVYEGRLAGSNMKVAVKKFRSGSNQGESEYISEVKVISRLMHKNLVQLKGWCQENGQLILVYEFMPNRSLDIHLFGKNSPSLTWPTRYKISLGLASALHYLQEGSDPSVIHRDIKSSNVMLDSNFNTKLGDFGLAKLTDHDQSLTPTMPAGTLGYLAPEAIMKGKVSKSSDTYSFGVVALEIASGRRAIDQSEEDPSKVNLVIDWVWDLYKKGLVLEAVDKRLNGEYEKDQARRLMVVGLWCCHPDAGYRPSIKQVIAALNFETDEPNVPLVMPTLAYISPLINLSLPSSRTTETE